MTDEQITTYLDAIIAAYVAFRTDCKSRADASMAAYYDEAIANFKRDLHIVSGKKYIKVIRTGTGVHSFIVKEDMVESNGKVWKAGDVLKAASYSAPAKNFARGNIIDGKFPTLSWIRA